MMMKTKYEDIETLIDMAQEDEDTDLIEEATALMDEFETKYEELRISTLLTGEYDKDDAILTLHAGAGGTESCDWAGMLYRMYSKWADSHSEDFRDECLWIFEIRERCSPSCPNFAIQRSRKATNIICIL